MGASQSPSGPPPNQSGCPPRITRGDLVNPSNPRSRLRAVSHLGASAGSVLCGISLSNSGLRLRVLQDQVKGHDGPLKGDFVILDAGDNKHSPSLEDLLNRPIDATEVLAVIRR